MSGSVTSWPAYRFLRRQTLLSSPHSVGDPGSMPGSGRSPEEGHGNPLQYSCLENPIDRGVWQVIVVHGDTKSWTQLSDYHIRDVSNLIPGFSTLYKSSLYIWKLLAYVLLKHSLKDFEHYLASMRNEGNCTVVWTLFGTAFLWDWNENWPFPVLWPLLSFPNLLAYWLQHFNSIIFSDM